VRLLYRIKNREIDKMALWNGKSLLEELSRDDWSFASVDLRHVSAMERSLASATILEKLYRQIINNRKVTFFVLDEAHNFCPAIPWEDHQKAPRQIVHEIAAEGRKYGAFLMLLTQSPSKLSEQALSQCDNIILMKMSSGSEVQALQTVVRDAGSRLAQLAFNLDQGEAICMGGMVRSETSVKFDLRKTKPGGDDVSKEWARRHL
jgi:DNA helicase HerA-like ATPase